MAAWWGGDGRELFFGGAACAVRLCNVMKHVRAVALRARSASGWQWAHDGHLSARAVTVDLAASAQHRQVRAREPHFDALLAQRAA